MLLSQKDFLTPENGVTEGAGDEGGDVAMPYLMASTELSTTHQHISSDERKSPSPAPPLKPPSSPPPAQRTKCEDLPISAVKVFPSGVSNPVEGKEEGEGMVDKDGGGMKEGEVAQDRDKKDGVIPKLVELNTSVSVKIADLGNACWVVSAAM